MRISVWALGILLAASLSGCAGVGLNIGLGGSGLGVGVGVGSGGDVNVGVGAGGRVGNVGVGGSVSVPAGNIGKDKDGKKTDEADAAKDAEAIKRP